MEKKKFNKELCNLIRTDEDSYNGIRKQLSRIQESLNKRENREDALVEQVKQLQKDLVEKTTDDRVRVLEAQMRDLRRRSVGIMSEGEVADREAAYAEHYKTGCKRNPHLELHFTGLGTAYIVKCEKCGFEVNVTDYNW